MNDYRTIKIRIETYHEMKVLAAQCRESILDLLERLVAEEQERRSVTTPITTPRARQAPEEK